jgi:hypothetical protein
VGKEEFFIDLLFYHLKLRAFMVIDLKMQSFRPEFAGKMNFYLSAVNELLRHPDDQPSIARISHPKKHHVPVVILFQPISCLYLVNYAPHNLKFGKPKATRASQPAASPFGQFWETLRNTPLRVDLSGCKFGC